LVAVDVGVGVCGKVLVAVGVKVRVGVSSVPVSGVEVLVDVCVAVGMGVGVLNQPPRLLSTARKAKAVRRRNPAIENKMIFVFISLFPGCHCSGPQAPRARESRSRGRRSLMFIEPVAKRHTIGYNQECENLFLE
jgi:hypothetical protein